MAKSKAYWARRKAQLMYEYMDEAEDVAAEIAKLYYKSSRYLSVKSDKIFERFRKKHSLTESEARALLNKMQDKTSIAELKKVLKDAGGDDKAAILAELEAPAYQYRIEQARQMQNEIDRTMRDVYRLEKPMHTSFYVDLANESYYKNIFEIQRQTGLGFSFAKLDPKVVDRLLKTNWSGANYSDRLWHNTQALAKDLKEELMLNLLTGRTERETAEIIGNKFGQGAMESRRLIRTESCFVAEQMEMQAYAECDIEWYIYVATLDLRTSEQCRELDNKRFKVAEQKPGENCPPMHPWCRSTTICDIDAAALAKMTRRARNPKMGKTYKVPANMSYEQWLKQYGNQ